MFKRSQSLPDIAPTRIPRLGDFIRKNLEPIASEWTHFARTMTPASDDMTTLALRDHIKEILAFIADDLESPQTGAEQIVKSQGNGPKKDGNQDSAAETHAALRLIDGFDIDQMVSEYRALRASVVKLWSAKGNAIDNTDLSDLTRFNEAIDQAIAESINHYTKKIDHSRNTFLGILGHDLRNPIGAASLSAQLMVAKGTLDPKQRILAAQIIDCTARASLIVTDLLDLTRASLGSGLPVVKAPMDMGLIARQLIAEMEASNPGHEITLTTVGDMQGEWDAGRAGQLFSNLIGNAIQYSFKDTPVSVTITGEPEDIVLSIHNEGAPIPAGKMGRIFDALIRGTDAGEEQIGSTNLGLGLYITKKIVTSHGGTINVASSKESGTTFLVKFPRLDVR